MIDQTRRASIAAVSGNHAQLVSASLALDDRLAEFDWTTGHIDYGGSNGCLQLPIYSIDPTVDYGIDRSEVHGYINFAWQLLPDGSFSVDVAGIGH